ncbi:MAG: ArsA family ATPase [Proteobacteria bacterium]|nr:ArsA family ATPase [Pseudomonadota bacterium]
MRIILFAGKGGVGKTSISSATGLAAAEQGLKTHIMSLDTAHSLADAFDLDRRLMDKNKGRPVEVADNLSIQEIDVVEEIDKNWGEVYRYFATLLNVTGLDEVLAEELAVLPGMEEVSALLYINRYLRQNKYDVIVLDCAPTGESLRFVSIPTALEWYMRKLFQIERRVAKLARPVLKRFTDVPLPEDDYFDALERLFERLEGVEKVLTDPAMTTVRLVTNPEKIVLRETQRAFMYFCMYHMSIDAVIINRVLPARAAEGYFENWRQAQLEHIEQAKECFAPVPMFEVPFYENEVVGPEALAKLGRELYQTHDPTDVLFSRPPYRFEKENGCYRLEVHLPFVVSDDVELANRGEDLIIRIGNFRQHILLPRHMASREPSGAKIDEDRLSITFE